MPFTPDPNGIKIRAFSREKTLRNPLKKHLKASFGRQSGSGFPRKLPGKSGIGPEQYRSIPGTLSNRAKYSQTLLILMPFTPDPYFLQRKPKC